MFSYFKEKTSTLRKLQEHLNFSQHLMRSLVTQHSHQTIVLTALFFIVAIVWWVYISIVLWISMMAIDVVHVFMPFFLSFLERGVFNILVIKLHFKSLAHFSVCLSSYWFVVLYISSIFLYQLYAYKYLLLCGFHFLFS